MDVEQKPPRVVVTAAWRNEQQAKREAYEAKRRAWVQTFEHGAQAEEDESPGIRRNGTTRCLGNQGCGRPASARTAGWHSSGQAPGALHILTRRDRQPFLGRASRKGGETPVTERRSQRPILVHRGAGNITGGASRTKPEKRRGPRGPRRGASSEGGHLGGC
jgi:hypothetical protein